MSRRNRSTTPVRSSAQNVDGGWGDVHVHVLLEMSGKFAVLEPEIFLDIMSRVPLKHLSQCRWVCKSWYKLIKSPRFAHIQFEWAAQNNSGCAFLLSDDRDFLLVDEQVFDNLETSATTHDAKLNEFEQIFHQNRIVVAGYANGLVCFTGYGDLFPFYICNPITGEHITIPKTPFQGEPIERCSFGFDPTTNEYKVMRFFEYRDDNGEHSNLEGEVYTLGSSEWRNIEDIENVPSFGDPGLRGLPVNGNLHWISFLDNYAILIVAFNVGAERFNVIQPPNDLPQDGIKRVDVVDKYLCVLYNCAPIKPYDIWVMQDYGVQSSWVKKYSFSFNENLFNWLYCRGTNSLMKLGNGEILIHCGTKEDVIICYDTKRKTSRYIKVNRPMEFAVVMVVQVGSLFSPKDIDISRRVEA